jgi:protein TonB
MNSSDAGTHAIRANGVRRRKVTTLVDARRNGVAAAVSKPAEEVTTSAQLMEADMRWFIVPVSIGAHVIAGVVMLIVPLAADVEWPTPAPLHPLIVTAAAPVPPAVAALASSRRETPAPSFDTPRTIGAEQPVPQSPSTAFGPASSDAPALSTGVPAGVGTTIAVDTPAPPPAPPQAPPAAPLRVGHGVREPRRIVDVKPVYPALALSARVEGAVILEAVINQQGVVERVKVLRSVALLDAAAVDAVSRWRYTPTLLNGSPVAVLMTITVNFTLQR